MRRHEFIVRLQLYGIPLVVLVFCGNGFAHTEQPAAVTADGQHYAGLSEELELIKEEEILRGTGSQERSNSRVPPEMVVMTEEDIRRSGATDIPSLLRRIPGMESMSPTGASVSGSTPSSHQAGVGKLLIKVDGRPIYDDAQGAVNWTLIPVAIQDIKRIEVLTGAASTSWEFDGVINILTKSQEER